MVVLSYHYTRENLEDRLHKEILGIEGEVKRLEKGAKAIMRMFYTIMDLRKVENLLGENVNNPKEVLDHLVSYRKMKEKYLRRINYKLKKYFEGSRKRSFKQNLAYEIIRSYVDEIARKNLDVVSIRLLSFVKYMGPKEEGVYRAIAHFVGEDIRSLIKEDLKEAVNLADTEGKLAELYYVLTGKTIKGYSMKHVRQSLKLLKEFPNIYERYTKRAEDIKKRLANTSIMIKKAVFPLHLEDKLRNMLIVDYTLLDNVLNSLRFYYGRALRVYSDITGEAIP